MRRKLILHDVPFWVPSDALFFITVCGLPRRQNQFCHGDVAQAMIESVVTRWRLEQWYPVIFLCMPDHVHLIVGFGEDTEMESSLASWKRYAARHLGVRWQRGYFEHRIRHDESADEKIEYVRMNPVRAGYVERPEDWPYVWTCQDVR